MRNRLATMACTSSIGPGATNMVTGAALATINRLPVLLLPGDVFASHLPDPVLQQLEVPSRGDVSVNDCLAPVSRYFDRVIRPEQLVRSGLNAMRVLTSQADTGAVTLALPQDVQAEAHDFPEEFFARRVWHVRRPLPDGRALEAAAALVRAARRPLIVAGGGVIYSEATETLAGLAEAMGIPVCETQAGKGSLRHGSPVLLGAVGATGTSAANRVAASADLVIGVGTRWSDFTTASRSAFRAPGVRFVTVNVGEFDAAKQSALALVGDARATLEALGRLLEGHQVDPEYRRETQRLAADWDVEVDRLTHLGHSPLPAQSEVLGAVNELSGPRDVVVCAAGSMPGDLHKLWRARDPKSYHVEYGYSCMGYEIPGGIGVKLAAPDREVYVLVGDGSYLMLPGEIVTAVQEGVKLTIVLVDNHGFSSIGSLSRSLGQDGFGTLYRFRQDDSLGLDSDADPAPDLPLDLAANAASLGARVIRAAGIDQFRDALREARRADRTVLITVEVDRHAEVPTYDSWWEVPVAEVSEMESVREARLRFETGKARQRVDL
jgi:3D-(3,5/4)-trihydroxycyclohexane-1,2-dione acylhydrolase (decyclizing)